MITRAVTMCVKMLQVYDPDYIPLIPSLIENYQPTREDENT